MKLSLIVAMDKNGLIGKDGGLPWPRIPEDMRHFRRLTMGKPVIMGRKTFDAVGELPGRTTIAMSRSMPYRRPRRDRSGVATTPYAAIGCAVAMWFDEAWIAGGAATYKAFAGMAVLTSAHVTLIDGEFEGDVYFPFPILGSPDWWPLAEPETLAPGVVHHHLGRVGR